MSPVWKRIAAAAFLTFLALWVAALVGGFTLPLPQVSADFVASSSTPSRQDGMNRQQLANNLRELGLAREPVRGVLDRVDIEKIQVHEKTGRVAATTTDFTADEAAVRAALADQKAVVADETAGGVAPDRRLTIEVGVSPDRFDALVERLQRIGRLESLRVEQRDRTGEFRQLAARRQSLKKHLETVSKLSTRDNATDDSLKLAREVKDIERELETLSAQAGDFLGKESLYTVTVTLVEDEVGRDGPTVTLARRTGKALLWAGAWWGVVAVVVGSLAGAFASARVLMPATWHGPFGRTAPPA
ncbi:DUF4349 domain-containing protein [bacterium]|nr:DUF4349 domain-containing protein [bacterium]